MAFDLGNMLGDAAGAIGGLAGNSSGWTAGTAQASTPTTDQRPQVDGGNASAAQPNATADVDSKNTLHWSAAIVLTALAILWLGGAGFLKASNF